MAYRLEGNDIVIDGWERGISDGPYQIQVPGALGPVNQTGTVDLSYGNISGIPGEFSVQFPLTVSTLAGGTLKPVVQITRRLDPTSGGTVVKYYLIDNSGQIWKSNTAGNTVTWTRTGTIGGTNYYAICWWQSYLFTFVDGKIYYSSDEGANNTDWSSSVPGMQNTGTHYAISSQVSDVMYFCNGQYVGAVILTQGKTFDPTDTSTYTAQGKQVSIPNYDISTCLAEINGQVLIGGALNRVYPWDAQNLSGSGVTSLVGLPLFLGDRWVQRIVVMNTNAYIFTGHPIIPTGRGNIYISNGSQVDIFKKMPDNLTTISGSVSQIQEPYWVFGDAMFHRNKLMFGAYAIDNINSASITNTGGVWAIDVNTQALFRISKPSTGTTSLVTAISPNDTGTNIAGLGYVAGTLSGSNGVMDNTTTSLSTSAIVISDKIPAGTFLNKKTYEQIELKTAVALASGESISVVVITDINPSGLSVGSMTSTDGMSKVFTPLAFQGIQWFQIQCTLNPTNSSPTFVRLREIRIR